MSFAIEKQSHLDARRRLLRDGEMVEMEGWGWQLQDMSLSNNLLCWRMQQLRRREMKRSWSCNPRGRCKRECFVFPGLQELKSVKPCQSCRAHVVVVGICCQDWSPLGRKQRWLGKEQRCLWHGKERLIAEEDLPVHGGLVFSPSLPGACGQAPEVYCIHEQGNAPLGPHREASRSVVPEGILASGAI